MLAFEACLSSRLSYHALQSSALFPRCRIGRFLPRSKPNKWLAYLDKYVLFRRDLRRADGRYDLIHILDHSSAMYALRLRRSRVLVTCHDMLAVRGALEGLPGLERSAFGKLQQRWIVAGLRAADHVACVSEFTHRDVLRIAGLPEHRTSVILNGLYKPMEPLPADQAASLLERLGVPTDRPYLLNVSSGLHRKNRPWLVRLAAALRAAGNPFSLVIAGAELSPAIKGLAAELGVEDDILSVKRPNDDELRALYSRAYFFLFPSLFEGFGLPIIEAQSCGCPVITSDREPMREVAAGTCPLVDPEDPEGSVGTVLEAFDNRERWLEAARVNARRFQPDRMVREYVELYQQLVKA
ncbi:MAG: glycosyltransferase family 4 protein [Fimbriimonadaceae bacterium]